MQIDLKNKNGIRLLTQGKAVTENIEVIPSLEENKIITRNGLYSVPKDKAGFGDFQVNIIEGGVQYNVAFGDTPPEDTSKLWIKTAQPEAINIKLNANFTGSNKLEANIASLKNSIEGNYNSAAVGDNIYWIGGTTSLNITGKTTQCQKYNTKTGETSILSLTSNSLSNGIGYNCVEAVDGIIYSLGGNSYSKTISGHDTTYVSAIYKLDPINNALTTVAQLPFSKSFMSSAVVGKKIYLFGGRIDATGSSGYSSSICEFNTQSKTTTIMSVNCHASIKMGIAAVGTKIYLFGGQDYNQSYDKISIFDTENFSYTTLTTTKLPGQMHSITAESIGDKIYLFGGFNVTIGNYNREIYIFNTKTLELNSIGTYLPANMPTASSVAIDNKIFLYSYNCQYSNPNVIHAFTSFASLPKNHLLIEAHNSKNIFNILSNVEIGINKVYLGNEENQAEQVSAYINHIKNGIDYTNYYTSSVKELSSGTELTSSVECNVGDLVIAAIATRDTLILSDGWTLVSTSNTNSTDTTAQRLSWAYKIAESTTESITITQATAQRLYINMVALQGATGITDAGYTYADSSVTNITVTKPEGLVLWGMTAPTAATGNQWTASNEQSMVQLDTSTAARLAIGLDQSANENVTLNFPSASTMIAGCLAVQGMEEFCHAEPWERPQWDEI